MKTKISHLGRSTVSVILAVMMLLSTMLIGTISTANAVDNAPSVIYFAPSTDWAGESCQFRLKVLYSEANANEINMTKIDGTEIYKGVINNTSYNAIQFLRYDANNDRLRDYSNTCSSSSIPTGMNYYTMNNVLWSNWDINEINGKWDYYSESSPVAKSVTLTPETQSIVKGESATLTATLAEKADTAVTLTLKGSDNSQQTATVSGSDTSATFTVSPESDTTYTVTASANGYDSVVSGNADVTVTGSKIYYIWTSPSSNLNDSSKWTMHTMSYNADGSYTFDYTFTALNTDCYVTITESVTNCYDTMAWSSSELNEVTDNSTVVKKARIQENYVGSTKYKYPQLIPEKTGTVTITYDSSTKHVSVTDSGATPTGPMYALAGQLADNKWDIFQENYLVSNVTSYGSNVFSCEVDVTTDTTYFNLIDSDNTRYGSSDNGSDEDISTHTSQSTSYQTVITNGNSGTALSLPKGKYTFFVDQSVKPPKVWVERIVDTKNVNFSITGDGTGTVSLNGTNVSNNASKAVGIGKQYTVELTPSADSYVKSFKVGGKIVSGNTYTATMPNEDVAVEVVFAKKVSHAIQITADTGGTAKANLTTAYSGQKVTVTVSADDDDHIFDGISVTENTSQNTVNCTKNEDGTYSFVMPDNDVNVHAKFREKLTYNVTVSSENQELGKVSLDGSENTLTKIVKEGETVIIKATPTGSNIFKSWSINGTYAIKDSKTTSDADITIVVKSNITATASFKETSPYQVAYGKERTLMEMVATRNKGIYISTATVDSSTESDPSDTPTAQFTIYDVKNSEYAVFRDNSYIWLTSSNPSDTVDDWIKSYTHGVGNGLLNNGYGKKMYVIYNANTQTVTLTDSFDTGDKSTLYVKTGTSGAGATGEYASKSEAPKLSATSSGTTYKKYSVEYDTNVNIQTTMSDKYLKARYYVAGYSVNGRSYPASAVDASKGIYQTNITITEDLAENGVVEVTPIYYNRTIEKDDNYITFYVDAERLVGGWGSTVAIYAYAYKGGTAIYGGDGKPTNNVNLLGAYPGQPMVKDGQYYVAKIPRCNYVISSDDGSLEIDKKSTVAGITLNNYYNDAVHNSLVPIKRNMQTYDFSDFVALANKKDVKTIMFQSKFYNATGDAKRNTKVIYGYDTKISDPTKATKQIDNIKSADVNPYEDFTDYYGRATDLIGNILDDTQKADENNLYVISTGSYDSSKSTSGYSTKGQWVTIWNVYDHNGDLITYGTPANFLDETTEQYQVIAEKYKGKPVKISYEKGLSYDNGVTSRTDGRWYYSTLGQEFTSDVAIEYKENQNDKVYTADIDSNAGNNTGFVGVTTKATATINNVTTASFSSVTETAHLNIKVANGWRFDGWYINDDKIGDNYTDISTDILMSNSYHIVARVSKIPTGTLELNHTAYTGPESHSGTGFYYISAVLKKEGGSEIKFDETQGKISIDKFAATDSLEITLSAKCHGDNTVYALYKGEAGGYTEIGTGLNGKSEFKYTVTVPAGLLFENGKLAVNALNYYTDIVKIGGTCDITYKYFDRFSVEGEGNMVSYVVKNVELSTYEITHEYIPTDETITKYAPRIDTMYVETKWNLTDTEKVKKGRSQATVFATQTPKTCDVYYPNKDGEYYTDSMNIKTVDYNTLFKDENGNFILSAPETDKSGKQFSYWDVYKADKNGGNTGELVTKCYERNFGLRIMADYYIVPVYNEKAPTLTANINTPVLNREIYGDSANPTDKLYVDLLTAFTSSDIPTFKENTTNLSVECGVFVVRNNTKTLSETDRNTLVQEALDKNSVDTTSTILETYKRTSNTEESVVNKLEALAVDSNVKDKSNTLDTFDNEQYRITKFIFDNNTLTNKNRIDEVLKYTNNTANQNYIFSAYAFVVIKDSHGIVQKKKISDPQYFNLCYVGNKAL